MNSPSAFAPLAGAPTSAIPARALYSPKETEAILNVSHATCYRLIASGRLDARKIGSRTFIMAESIEAFLASLPKIGPAA